MQILRPGTLVVSNLQDHLVLVGGLLDEIDVVLRVRLVQKTKNPSLGDSVGLCLLAEDVDPQIRGMVEQVGVDEEESRELEHFAHQGSGAGIDLVRIDPGNRISKLALQLRSEEHTSELQSRLHLVCRLLLETNKKLPLLT